MERVINIPIKVTEKNVNDIMTTAICGGINYWGRDYEVKGFESTLQAREKLGIECGYDALSKGETLLIYEIDEEEPVELNLDKFMIGLEMMLKLRLGQGHHGYIEDGNLECGQIDCDDADLVIQYALFGKLVYC